MNALTVRCIRAAFIFLATGIGLGVTFAFDRALGGALRPLHAEFNLWGWVTLLIYGMGYHMVPRFTGRPLRRIRLAAFQSWMAIVGVALAGIGWGALAFELPWARLVLVAGGVCEVGAALIFGALIAALLRPTRLRAGRLSA